MAMAMALPQAAKKAPEQSSTRPAAHRPFDAPFSGGTDVGTLLFLQRTAGNAAVTSLLEAQRRPLHIQRCAGRACDCPPEERHEGPRPDHSDAAHRAGVEELDELA